MTDSNPFGALNEAEDTYDTSQEGQQKDASVIHQCFDCVSRELTHTHTSFMT